MQSQEDTGTVEEEELSCRCKSTCSTKSGRIRVGCPCKTANKKCTSQCSCGTRQKPCKNKVTDQPERREPDRASEAQERDLENQRVKEFILTLDEEMAKKLAIRALQRGVGSMEFIDMLLIMEDPNESSDESSVAPLATPLDPSTSGSSSTDQPTPLASGAVVPRPTSTMENLSEPVPDWCKCGQCRTMPQEIENKCCNQRSCVWTQNTFSLVLETLMIFGMIVMIIAVGLFEKQPIAIL
ncbi:uncharacterized protein LOC114950455 isoform X2 [Acropora millepora]|uniref:uncharacterized protein LOC114950455 isoform X2 n=1 Tax=Acropora millepora TaxID=45264 RepID=UPI001CF3393E|nr:uncharacterized protein LOC114950455 isoform X2 [Acropora millepora]